MGHCLFSLFFVVVFLDYELSIKFCSYKYHNHNYYTINSLLSEVLDSKMPLFFSAKASIARSSQRRKNRGALEITLTQIRRLNEIITIIERNHFRKTVPVFYRRDITRIRDSYTDLVLTFQSLKRKLDYREQVEWREVLDLRAQVFLVLDKAIRVERLICLETSKTG